jgi:hypothetical protein
MATADAAVTVWKLKLEILANPSSLSHTQDALVEAESEQTKTWTLVEFEMVKCTKPDNTRILFAEFWVVNVYGLSPAYAGCSACIFLLLCPLYLFSSSSLDLFFIFKRSLKDRGKMLWRGGRLSYVTAQILCLSGTQKIQPFCESCVF